MYVKRLILVVLILLGFLSFVIYRQKSEHPTYDKTYSDEAFKFDVPFKVGEKLHYVIAWQGIPVGDATVTVETLMPFKDYEVYKIVVHAKTNAFLSMLFKIDDTFISYIDKDKLISRRCENIIREGNYKKDLIVDYDSKKLIATYTNLGDGSVKTCPIEKNVQDPVSAAYFFRTIPMNVGDEINLVINHSEKNYVISGDVEKKTTFNLRKIGTFEAFLIKPYLKLDNKKLKRANTWGYLSADEKRIILYVNIKVLEIPWIGEVTATLANIEYVSPTQK